MNWKQIVISFVAGVVLTLAFLMIREYYIKSKLGKESGVTETPEGESPQDQRQVTTTVETRPTAQNMGSVVALN